MSQLSWGMGMGMGGNWDLLDGKKWEWDVSFKWEWEWDGNEVLEMGGICVRKICSRTSLLDGRPHVTSALGADMRTCLHLQITSIRDVNVLVRMYTQINLKHAFKMAGFSMNACFESCTPSVSGCVDDALHIAQCCAKRFAGTELCSQASYCDDVK